MNLNIPFRVIECLAMIRDTGQINMFDYQGAIEIAELVDDQVSAKWLRENKTLYVEALNETGAYITAPDAYLEERKAAEFRAMQTVSLDAPESQKKADSRNAGEGEAVTPHALSEEAYQRAIEVPHNLPAEPQDAPEGDKTYYIWGRDGDGVYDGIEVRIVSNDGERVMVVPVEGEDEPRSFRRSELRPMTDDLRSVLNKLDRTTDKLIEELQFSQAVKEYKDSLKDELADTRRQLTEAQERIAQLEAALVDAAVKAKAIDARVTTLIEIATEPDAWMQYRVRGEDRNVVIDRIDGQVTHFVGEITRAAAALTASDTSEGER